MTRILPLLSAVLLIGATASLADDDAAKKAMPSPAAMPGMQAGQHGMMGGLMGEGMLVMPEFNPSRGRKLFASKGCVACHSINGIGGTDAPALDAATMPRPMNPFEFAAKMWRGAEAMVEMQRDELGSQIELTGQELVDIIAFVHSNKEQPLFSEDDIPHEIRELIEHEDDEEEAAH